MPESRRTRTIDLNAADESDLMTIEGIDQERASLIVEHRSKRGGFESWEAVEAVPGIAASMVEKLRSSASLGGEETSSRGPARTGNGKEAPAGEAEAEEGEGVSAAEEEIEVEEEEGVVVTETGAMLDMNDQIEALTAIADLDREAAAAYGIAAAGSEDEELAKALSAFRGDHQRHIKDLNRHIVRMGGAAVDEAAEAEGILLGRLAETACALGDRDILLAMTSNEHLTNGTYLTALELPLDDEIRKVLERNFGDEQRHLQYLVDAFERANAAAQEEGQEELPATP